MGDMSSPSSFVALGLDALVAKIGLSARQFGENVHKHFKKYEPQDAQFDLEVSDEMG